MKKEIRILFTAIQFLTRIKVPDYTWSPEYLKQAPRYFPVVGWLVGAISALFFLLGMRYVSVDAGVLASMIAGLLVTGAFHEDGFADVCDGFGGGMTREKILDIMKDSRIGAYGAIGLIAILGSKFVLLKELPSFVPVLGESHTVFYNYRYLIVGLIAAHSLSRLMAVLVMRTGEYAGVSDRSKSIAVVGPLSPVGLIVAILTGLAPLAFLPWHFWLVVPMALYTAYQLQRYFLRRIGGYTGDCLGAIQQVTEIVIYLGFVLVWRYF